MSVRQPGVPCQASLPRKAGIGGAGTEGITFHGRLGRPRGVRQHQVTIASCVVSSKLSRIRFQGISKHASYGVWQGRRARKELEIMKVSAALSLQADHRHSVSVHPRQQQWCGQGVRPAGPGPRCASQVCLQRPANFCVTTAPPRVRCDGSCTCERTSSDEPSGPRSRPTPSGPCESWSRA